MNPSLMITDHTSRPTLTPPQCLNGFRVDGDLWAQKALMVTATFSYYHGWCKNAYLHYEWSVWLVATLVASTSWSFPIACIALVWGTREKGTEFFCTTRRTKKIKFLSFCFSSRGHLSLTVIVATPIAVITSRVVIVAIAAISVALLSITITLVVSLVPVVVIALIPVLALT